MSRPVPRGSDSTPRDGFRVPAWAPAACVLAVVLFTTLVRLRLADTPLERDEGEYAYAGRLILGGVPPYELAWNMKFPGTYYAYAAILAVFGPTAWGVHAGLAVVNAATTWLVFRLGRRLCGDFAGVAASAAFALLSLDRQIMGVWAHATHFVALAVVAALVVLLRAQESGRRRGFLAAGVLFGVALLMKQHAVFFVPLGAYLAFADARRREPGGVRGAAANAGCVAAGAAIPFALVVAVCAAQGVLGRFWFWTFTYASSYVTEEPLSTATGVFAAAFAGVVRETLPLWIAAGAGFVALWTARRAAGVRPLVAGLLIASFLAICPGFYFRPHYFIVVLPAAALLVGFAAQGLDAAAARFLPARSARIVAAVALAGLCAGYVVAEREYLFSMSPRDLSRARYGANPFVEAPEIARYIRERTHPDDRVAVLGSEPEILFHAGRVGATGYLYAYPLMESQPLAARMQDEMIREIESSAPAYFVSVAIGSSWLAGPQSDRRIFDWRDRYLAAQYDLVGVADIVSPTETRFVWDAAARGYSPASPNVVLTFRRRD